MNPIAKLPLPAAAPSDNAASTGFQPAAKPESHTGSFENLLTANRKANSNDQPRFTPGKNLRANSTKEPGRPSAKLSAPDNQSATDRSKNNSNTLKKTGPADSTTKELAESEDDTEQDAPEPVHDELLLPTLAPTAAPAPAPAPADFGFDLDGKPELDDTAAPPTLAALTNQPTPTQTSTQMGSMHAPLDKEIRPPTNADSAEAPAPDCTNISSALEANVRRLTATPLATTAAAPLATTAAAPAATPAAAPAAATAQPATAATPDAQPIPSALSPEASANATELSAPGPLATNTKTTPEQITVGAKQKNQALESFPMQAIIGSKFAAQAARADGTQTKDNSSTEKEAGIATAMQSVVMSKPVNPQQAAPKSAAFADMPLHSAAGNTLAPQAQGQDSQQNAGGRKSSDQNANSGNDAEPIQATPQMTGLAMPASAGAIQKPAALPAVEIVPVIHRTLDAAEQLRVSGQDRIEVRMRLDNGQELLIELRVSQQGEVKPTFRTESDALRLALEQNWSRFSASSTERGIKLANPVFETPQTQSGMSDLNQNHDGRERAFAQARDEHFIPLPAMRPAAKTSAPSNPQLVSSNDRVSRYA